MKTYRRKLILAPSLTAIALCFAALPATQAQDQPPDRSPADTSQPTDTSTTTQGRATDLPPPADPLDPTAPDQLLAQPQQSTTTVLAASETIQIAGADAKDRGVRRYAGQEVRAGDGERLGKLKDFVIDTSSGKIAYAVVSSGGFLGAGDTLRVIPGDALQRSTAIDGFAVDFDPAQWPQLQAIDEKNFQAGRIEISADQLRQLNQVFETAAQSVPSAQLRRASELRGKSIQAGEQKIGDIEEVIINVKQGTASVLVDPASDFASTDAKYLVPIQRLNLASTDNVVTATLTRTDFDQAKMQVQIVAATSTTTDEQLSPTGRTSAEQAPQVDAALIASAQVVRQALDQDTALATANVQVTPENGKLVLRGSVRDQQTRSDVERAAKQAAASAQIDNQITIENQNR